MPLKMLCSRAELFFFSKKMYPLERLKFVVKCLISIPRPSAVLVRFLQLNAVLFYVHMRNSWVSLSGAISTHLSSARESFTRLHLAANGGIKLPH